jgi:hypothetical protein
MVPSLHLSLHRASAGSPRPEVRKDFWRVPESQNSHGACPNFPSVPVRNDRRDEQDDPVQQH